MVAINSHVRRVSKVLAVRALRAATSARIRRIVPRELVMFSGHALQGDKDLDGPPRERWVLVGEEPPRSRSLRHAAPALINVK